MTDLIVEISARKEDEGGGLVPTLKITGDWRAIQASSEVLLLIHGFNNTLKEARDSYAKFARHHYTRGLATIHFYWPGDIGRDVFWGKLKALFYYAEDLNRARGAADLLVAKLGELRDGVFLHIAAHSMGSRLALEMLDRVMRWQATGSTWTPQRGPLVQLLFMMAGAVPEELTQPSLGWWERSACLYNAETLATKLRIAYSQRDHVCGSAFPLGQTLARLMNIESRAYQRAIGYWGQSESLVGDVNNIPSSNGHGDYWPGRARKVVESFEAAIDIAPPRSTATRTTPAALLQPTSDIASRSTPTHSTPSRAPPSPRP